MIQCAYGGAIVKKDNLNFANILGYKDWIYLMALMGVIIIAILFDPKMIIPGLIIWGLLLVYSLHSNSKRRKEIEKYIENLTFNMDVVTKDTLLNFPLPMVTVELNGMIIWHNNLFQEIILNKESMIEKYLSDIIDGFNPEELINADKTISKSIRIQDRDYSVVGSLIRVDNKENREHYIVALYFIDNSEYTNLLQRYIAEYPNIGIIIIDNYDELMQSIVDTGRPQLLAEIDRTINEWYDFTGGIVKKYERDKYVMFFESQYMQALKDKKFEVLDKVKEIDIGNKLPVTLSIGISSEAQDFSERLKNALTAIDIAMGRGGDQAVIKEGDEYIFFGGQSKELEKRTRVKARVMANALEKLIEDSDNVIIQGHSNADADSIGAALGIYRMAKSFNREAHIVLEDINVTIKEIIDRLEKTGQYEDVFIGKNEALDKIGPKTVLVIVDTHRANLTAVPELLSFTDKVVVIDHHRKVTDFISNLFLQYHEIYASSACELVTELLQYMEKKVELRQSEAEILYAGMMMDTKNFTFKTGVRTFEAAAFLKKVGVDTVAVKQLFKNDINTYISRAEVVKNAEIINNEIAISQCPKGLDNPQLITAQAADELLNITGIKASFVVSEKDKRIIISGRSLGEINVQIILEKLGGGGHITMAGTQLDEISIEEAIEKLKVAINEFFEEREAVK